MDYVFMRVLFSFVFSDRSSSQKFLKWGTGLKFYPSGGATWFFEN